MSGATSRRSSLGPASEEDAPAPNARAGLWERLMMGATHEQSLRHTLPTERAAKDNFDAIPAARGLFDPALEKDSCGVGFVADIKGRKSHKIVQDALQVLLNLEHRGAVGADPRAGDGAGILVQIPHRFFVRKAGELGIALPEPGQYAVGYVFMPHDPEWRDVIMDIFHEVVPREGLVLLGWREVPTDNSSLGQSVKPTEPFHMQVF